MKLKLLPLAVGAIVAAQANAGTVTSAGQDIVIDTKGGFKLYTADKKNKFQIGGRIQWDYNYSEEDPDAGSSRNDESQFDVRRARIFLKGQVGNWAYKSQFNLDDEDGDSGGTIEDLYIRYKGFGKGANITLGRAKAPFGLEELTSSKDISILERTAITELYVPGRQDGVQIHGKFGSMFTYGAGLYESGSDDDDQEARDLSFVGRVTAAPINEKGRVLHFGLAYQTVGGADNEDQDFAFSVEDAIGFEVAAVTGPVHFQAEYFTADLREGGTIAGEDDPSGYYAQVGWIVTGESRPYKDGKFKRVKPSNSSGAVELVARYEDGEGNYSDIELGASDSTAFTLGANWYVNKNIRLGVSYSTGEDENTDDEGEEYRARFQFVF